MLNVRQRMGMMSSHTVSSSTVLGDFIPLRVVVVTNVAVVANVAVVGTMAMADTELDCNNISGVDVKYLQKIELN